MEEKESSAISEVKTWIFPGIVSLIGLFAGMMLNGIQQDLAEVKSDIKILMAQSNIDKTRIDNLERQVYKSTAAAPIQPSREESTREVMYAVLPDNKIKFIR